LREERRLGVLRTFGPERDEVTGVEKNTDEELNGLYSTQYCWGDQIEKNEMGGACSAYGVEERHKQGFGRET
jgi:hypothetical protein